MQLKWKNYDLTKQDRIKILGFDEDNCQTAEDEIEFEKVLTQKEIN